MNTQRSLLSTLVASLLSLPLFANERWTNQEIIQINTLEPRATYTPFQSIEAVTSLAQVEYVVGAGLKGRRGGLEYRSGSETFCRALAGELPPPPDETLYWVALCRKGLMALSQS